MFMSQCSRHSGKSSPGPGVRKIQMVRVCLFSSAVFWLGDLGKSLMLSGLQYLYQQNKTEGSPEHLFAVKVMTCPVGYRSS